MTLAQKLYSKRASYRLRFNDDFEVVDGRICYDDASKIKMFIDEIVDEIIMIHKVYYRNVELKTERSDATESKRKTLPLIKEVLYKKISEIELASKTDNESIENYCKKKRIFYSAEKACVRVIRNLSEADIINK